MSFDLYAWKAPVVTDEDEAGALVDRFAETDTPDMFTPSEDVTRFFDEMMGRYPAFVEEPAAGASRVDPGVDPWMVTPERSDRVIVMNLSFSTPNEVLEEIVGLAEKYDLVLYDPQGPSIHWPVLPDKPPDVAGQVRQALKAGGIGAVLLFVGTWLDLWFLRWPLIAVGGLMVLLTLYTLVVLWKPEWQPR